MLIRVLVGTGLVLACGLPAARPQSQNSPSPATRAVSQVATTQRALLRTYCVACHNERLPTAGVLLDKADIENAGENGALWEKVVHKLRTGSMPPAGRPRPDSSSYNSLISYLETRLDLASEARPNPGRPAIHRLNRVEYTNAIRDLFAIDIDGESLLPDDEVNNGFDNNADALSVTPVLMERYMSAARKVSRLAVGESEVHPVSEKFEIHTFLMQEDRMSDDLPFGSRGGIAFRYYFPFDGEYRIRVFLQRNSRNYIRGLATRSQLDFRLDQQRIQLLTIGGVDELKKPDVADSKCVGDADENVMANAGTTWKKCGPSPPFSQATLIGDDVSETYENGGAEENLEVRFRSKAGQRLVGVTFLNRNAIREGVYRPRMNQFQTVQHKGDEPAIDNVVISGPYDAAGVRDTASRQKIFVCRPTGTADEEPCARKILSTLARRAYRRPLTDKELGTLVRVYDAERQEEGFEAGIRAALERILAGPEFLFRIERDPSNLAPGTSYRISDLELASRLSFFLWSSIPDDQLLNLAESGKLKDPAILEQQVHRMLADGRSRALVTNFAEQWLYLRNLRSKTPDPKLFSQFNESLREAFLQETELFLDSTLREDQSVLRLLDANYTFLNEQLAEHYGIPNVYGSHFRRVTLSPEFDARRGLLGHGSLLTVNSYANRTSVVLRGKWLLESILGSPPPPPPPNVPALEESEAEGKALPLRQLMEKHRANPGCANCHAPMDPLGFALENFDAIGRWRTVDADSPIDSSGILPDGIQLNGPSSLRTVLLRRPEEFVSVVAERMLTFALGRRMDFYDAPAIRKMVRDAARQDYRWSSLVISTVKSMPFQMRRTRNS
jgi:mono/diheme cytochrome c family protein